LRRVVVRIRDVEPFDSERSDDDVLDVRGSADSGTGLVCVVPLTVPVEVDGCVPLICSQGSRGEKGTKGTGKSVVSGCGYREDDKDLPWTTTTATGEVL